MRIKLGFKVPHRVNLLFSKIVHEMADNGEIELISRYEALQRHSMMADFKFVILHSWASTDSEISTFDSMINSGYKFIKSMSVSTEVLYGLELANVEIERVPILVGPVAKVRIKREATERPYTGAA